MDKQNLAYPYNRTLFSIKRGKILIYTITWMKLGNITQIGRS